MDEMRMVMTNRRYSIGYSEFKGYFGREADCAKFLLEARFKSDFRCHRCGTHRQFELHLSDYRVQCAGCSKSYFLRSGTMMERSSLPLTVWFEALWLLTVNRTNMTSEMLRHHLGICRHAARRLRAKIRAHMEWLCQREKLGANGRLVIVGDIQVKGIWRPSEPGYRKSTIVGAWDGVRLVVDAIPCRAPKYSVDFVKRSIEPGARFATYGTRLHSRVQSRKHFDLAKTTGFTDEVEFTSAKLGLESCFAHLRSRAIKAARVLWFDSLKAHLKEYEFRRLHQERPEEMFWDLISNQPRIERFRHY